MANFGNPMDYFNAGRAGGAARSPVSGVGNAIRGILQQGQKMGLIEAQAGGNLATGIATAGFKNQLATQRVAGAGAQPKGEVFKDPETGKTMVRNHTYDQHTGTWVERISPASVSMFEFATKGGDMSGGGTDEFNAAIAEALSKIQAQ